MVDTDPANETKSNKQVDGEKVLEVKTEGVSMIATQLGAIFDMLIGPNGEYSFEYSDSKLKFKGPDDSILFEIADADKQFTFNQAPLVPEYDSKSEAPDDPKAIFRFTSSASVSAPGLYSYSDAEGKYVRLDKP